MLRRAARGRGRHARLLTASHPPWLARRLQRNLATHGRRIYYADDHTPITGFKFFLNFMNEIFYGARSQQAAAAATVSFLWVPRGTYCAQPGRSPRRGCWLPVGYNFPCKDHRRGGTECVYFGHTDGVNPSGKLVPAQPPDFLDWMTQHLGGTTRRQMARCGWGNRGMVVVSRAAVRAHALPFYANLLAQLSDDVFPMAGMFMERLWRRVFLCSSMATGGEGGARLDDARSGRTARRMRDAAALGHNNPWLQDQHADGFP